MEADFDDQQRDAGDARSRRGHPPVDPNGRRLPREWVRGNTRRRCLPTSAMAVRLAARLPGWSLASALVLGLGIAAVTGGFTIVDAFLLRPLPFAGSKTGWCTCGRRISPTGVDSGRSSLPDIEAWAQGAAR